MTENLAAEPAAIEPEDRDWTYVITEGCADCGFRPNPAARTGALLRATLPAWEAALTSPDASVRPAPTTWSAVEYGSHVRDVARIFRGRLGLMRTEDAPTFANWDQDATAVEEDYFHADPAVVLEELKHEASETADAFDSMRADEWGRRGVRSNGSEFTIGTLAVYFLHDVVHHVNDVTR